MSLEEDLRRQAHQAVIARDGEQGLLLGQQGGWDLILLDLMLPKLDGFEVCRALRRAGVRAPILMLTALAQEAEKILGLDSGADDYITKPFSLRELRARIRAALRRNADCSGGVYRFGECEVDFDRAELRRSGQPVEVTPQELKLLATFIRNRGHALTRDQIIESAWGPGVAITDRAVDAHVFNLRRKIEPAPSDPRYLTGVRGIGYRFDG
jgi:DNA-binding response OmpR family regulator